MRLICVGVLSLYLAWPPLVFAQELDVARIYQKAAASVGLVIALDGQNQPLRLGSGFLIDSEGTFATNYHVIAGAQAIQVKFQDSDDLIAVQGIYSTDSNKDLAILKLSISGKQPLPLSPSRPIVGERVVAIGNPLGLESSVSEGIVSGIRRVSEDFELYQITAPLSPGNSGGPVLDAKGDVIGIATSTLESGQNLNFAVPVVQLVNLWQKGGTLRPIVEATLAKSSPAFGTDNVEELVRLVDTRMALDSRRDNWVEGSIYNGTQYSIRDIQIRVLCLRKGVDVPIGYATKTVIEGKRLEPVPPGLSKAFSIYCSSRATHFELRLLDYQIVRQ